MEIQKEAIIEIVGTQNDGYIAELRELNIDKKLKIKHKKDGIRDPNAVIVLDENDKELGYLPKDYASLYAPAIDSDKYNFIVEILETIMEPQRPILFIKITSELKSNSEADIEKEMLGLIQVIVNEYAQSSKEYQELIYSENIDAEKVIFVLNRVRLMHKLHTCSHKIIIDHGISQNSDKNDPIDSAMIIGRLSELKANISDIRMEIKKAYNEWLDIDDEEEYHKVENELRERSNKVRYYEKLISSLLDSAKTYVNISIDHTLSTVVKHENELSFTATDKSVEMSEFKNLSEHIESDIEFATLANAEHDSETVITENKQFEDDTDSEQILDINTPYAYERCRPCYFYYFGQQCIIKNNRDLYRTFLQLLYTDSNYKSILQGQINKSLGGKCVDFVSDPKSSGLRNPILIVENFYAEGDLSLANIIVRIKQLMTLCKISEDQMVIYYVKKHGKNNRK